MATPFKVVISFLCSVLISLSAYSQTGVGGSISGTWTKANSPYILNNNITVPVGQTLVIEAGVEVRFPDYYRSIEVYGTLLAQGTVSDSIRFQGIYRDANSNYGGRILFRAGGGASIMQYVAIDKLGDTWYGQGTINIAHPQTPTIQHVSIRNSEEYDVVTWVGGAKNFANISAPLVGIVTSASSVAARITKLNQGSRYRLLDNIRVEQGQTLTIDPGVKIEFPDYYRSIDVYGTLLAQGTASDSIRFQGLYRDANSNYGGRILFQAGGGASIMQYVAIDKLGDNWFGRGTISIAHPQTPTIQHVSIRNSEEYDMVTWVGGTNNVANVSAPLVGIVTSASSVAARITKLNQGSRYRLLDNIRVEQGQTLTIDPGVKIEFPDYYRSIEVYGTLLAQGTVSDSIRFQGIYLDANSNYGGRILFQAGGGTSIMQYVAIDRLGDTWFGRGTINIAYPQTPTIQHVSIRNSEEYDVVTWVGGTNNVANVSAPLVGIVTSASSVAAHLPKLNQGSRYRLIDYIRVEQGQTLTIDPGVKIEFPDYYRSIDVYGTLLAQGTASDSIRFQGLYLDANSNYGGRILFRAGGGASIMQYVAIDKLGDTWFGQGAINIAHPQTPTIQHVSIRNSEEYDVVTWVGGTNNVANVSAPLVGIVTSASSVAARITKLNQGSRYRLIDYIRVEQGQTLTIDPGVKVEFPDYYRSIDVYGTLLAQGTASDSIRFQGLYRDANSNYGGRILFQAGGGTSIMQYVAIDKLGDNWYGEGTIYINTNCTIRNVSIRNSEQTAILINNAALSPVLQNLRFANNPTEVRAFASNCANFSNINDAVILLNSGSTSTNATLPYVGASSNYLLAGQITIQPTYILTVAAGVLIDFGLQNGELIVNGALRALGTESSPIRFTRLESTTASVSGGRIYLSASSANSNLNFVTFDKLGNSQNNNAALDIATTNFSAGNITISNSRSRGLQLANVGQAVISGSNFFGNRTGVYVTSSRPVFTTCNIYANADFGINNVSSTVADTVDARNNYWGSSLGPLHPTLNPTGNGNPVSNKVKFNPWRQQPQNGQIIDVGISLIVGPITDCNHTSADNVTVRVRNYGNVSQTNIPISYQINTGPVITETISSTALLPGESIDYTFTQKANLATLGSYTLNAYSSFLADTFRLNDGKRVIIQNLPGVQPPTNQIPVNNTTDLDVSVQLSWAAVPGAFAYDLFVWRADAPVSTTPVASNLSQITYTLPGNSLQYGTTYKWKVVAKQVSCRAESTTLTFTTRRQADLIVESINVPSVATSETDIVISWKIKNQGTGATYDKNWFDVVYLCDQPVLNAGTDNFFVKSVSNFSALAVGQSYQSNTVTFRLPQGIQGKYYVIVQANSSRSVPEAVVTNNQLTSTAIAVSLAPPPDLQVTNVAAPQNAFSEDSINVSYTVKNTGTGPTTTSNWVDQIFLSQNQTVNTVTDKLLYTYDRRQILSVNGTYTVSARSKLPTRVVNGTYYIHVITDSRAQVFEYNKEDNNNRTVPINLIQRPTPNLIVSGLVVSGDTVSGNQPVSVQWTTTNDGALATSTSWQETIYMSSDTIFSETADKSIGNFWRNNALQSLSSSSLQQNISIPRSTTEGTYYLFVKTDVGDRIYENPDENDNVSSRSKAIHLVKPDLKPTQLTAPASSTSEQSIAIQWRVRNDSRGGIYNTTWKDRFYLSTNNTFEPAADKLISTVTVNQLLTAGSEYNKQISATLPVGVSGNYFLLLVSDADSSVSEKTETNNLLATPISIILAPWPDLQVTTINAPAADTLGTLFSLRYTVRNNGTGLIDNKIWQELIYLSPTSTVSENTLIRLGSVVQNRTLTGGQSFTQTASVNLPSTINPGSYLVVVRTDADNALFENTGEANNTTVSSTTVNLLSPPAVDLSVTTGTLSSTSPTAGQSMTVRWTVKNNSAQFTIASPWVDAIYLSANPLLDASDQLLATVSITQSLSSGATYSQSQAVTIPASAAGSLYVLVVTDRDNQHNDPQRGNNTLAVTGSGPTGQPVTITIPLPADLVPLSLKAPAEGVASQPINVSITVKNNGTGSTPTSNWTDELYLSTDLILGNDQLIGTFPHTGTLQAGTEYTLAKQVFLPSNVSGNYVLLLKTDAGNTVFERGNEDNNIAYANLAIAPQLPSDLVVSNISVPTGDRLAGRSVSLSWRLSNVGANAANGYLREVVYFSKDSLLDAGDVLFGTLDKTTYLPARASEVRTLTGTLANISTGDYYVIIRTDILNNILEQDESNNQAISSEKMRVTMKELVLNTITTDTLPNASALYYRLEIPSALVGETLSITLRGDSTNNAVNRLFIQKDSLPTPNRYGFVAAEPFKANQELFIPSLLAGTYYLMVVGNNPVASQQIARLLAKIIPFSISAVDAKEGGNTGLVTVKITGARLESTTKFSLRKGGSDRFMATKVSVINQTLAYATFDLQGKSLGLYDVVAEKPSAQTAVLAGSFTIKQGPGNTIATSGNGGPAYGTGFVCSVTNEGFDGQLTADFITPEGIRFGTLGTFQVAFKNEGSVDIPVPTRFVISLSEGAALSFTAEGLTTQKSELTLVCQEENGPPGVLRPGAGGFFRIYTLPNKRGMTSIDLIITE